MSEEKRSGQEFEEAVTGFAKSLDPDAEVLFNLSVSDRDTGEPRPCDAWINANFCSRWPLSVLVSCKDQERALNEGEIETFRDEIRSSGANTGIIYSRAGFTEAAVQKAQMNGISCCRILQNAPAELPGAFYFDQFACLPIVKLDLVEITPDVIIYTWDDIFALELIRGTILDRICKVIDEAEESAADEMKASPSFPDDWAVELQLSFNNPGDALRMQVNGYWKKYRAHVGATLRDGTYCFNNESVPEIQNGPTIDTLNPSTIESWKEIKEEDFRLPARNTITVLNHGKWRDALQAQVGPQSPFDEAP